MIPEIGRLPMNPLLTGQAEFRQHVVYSENGQELPLIIPWNHRDPRGPVEPSPLIVFIQGSGWTTPNLDYELPMLSRFAEEGVTVATVSHRSTKDGYPFPAFLRIRTRRLHQVLRREPCDGRSRNGRRSCRHYCGAVHRRARYAAYHENVPYRRREGRGRYHDRSSQSRGTV